jgi:hypothetical protein
VSDNITLRRAAEYARVALDRLLYCEKSCNCFGRDAITALDAALAEPDAKPEPVAWMYVNLEGECEQIEYGTPSIDDDSITLLYAAPPEPEPAFQVDAERYRWLRGEVQGPHTPLAQVVWKRNNIRESGDWTNLSDGQALDEAIDAAIDAAMQEDKT